MQRPKNIASPGQSHMPTNTQTIKRSSVPLPAIFGLDQACLYPKESNRFFFQSPLTKQRLSILNNMVGSSSLIIVVIGERGSGKTTLVNEFISSAGNDWQACRIKLLSDNKATHNRWRDLTNRAVYRSPKNHPPSIIIDDAHQLTANELKKLLQSAFRPDKQPKFKSIILLAEPAMRERFDEIARWLPPKSVIDKIYMTPLTEKQTADYLQHHLRVAGIIRNNPFTGDQVRKIYELSGGLPGWINGEALMLLKKMEKHHRSFRRSLLAKLSRWQSAIRWQTNRLKVITFFGKKPVTML
jgi:type II secretory pathway predicted ATPase ExeA